MNLNQCTARIIVRGEEIRCDYGSDHSALTHGNIGARALWWGDELGERRRIEAEQNTERRVQELEAALFEEKTQHKEDRIESQRRIESLEGLLLTARSNLNDAKEEAYDQGVRAGMSTVVLSPREAVISAEDIARGEHLEES